MDELLQQGIAAYQSGDRNEARRLLATYLKQNSNSEAGWGWLFHVCESDKERMDCLKQILRINPRNEKVVELLRKYTSGEQPLQPPVLDNDLEDQPARGAFAQKIRRFVDSLQDGSFSQYMIHHPLVFLMGVVLVAVFCYGGAYLLPAQGGSSSNPSLAASALSAATATLQNSGVAGITPGQLPAAGIKPTLLPLPSATAEATLVPASSVISTAAAPTPTLPPDATVSVRPLVVSFIDVGQGDSILITAPDGQTMLIDGGSAGSGALAYLQNQGIKRIDLMIATHPDEDHLGGLVEVLNAMPVKKVLTNGQSDTTPTYEHFLDAIANAKAEYGEAGRGDTISLGSLAFSVLNPAARNADNQNTNSLVLRMSYANTTFLYMGDADANAEAGILAADLPVQADILKVGHHGSCESSSPDFLDAVHPRVAIYSAGLNNPYGLPCAGTINALNTRGIFVFGTDLGGSIVVTVTSDGLSITNSTGVIFRR